MKNLLIILLFSVSAISNDKVISAAGVEYLKCGEYKIKGLLEMEKASSIFFLTVYPKTKRQYRIRLEGDVVPFFNRYAGKIHVTATGKIKRQGVAASATLHLTKPLEILNPNLKFEKVIIRKKDLSCEI